MVEQAVNKLFLLLQPAHWDLKDLFFQSNFLQSSNLSNANLIWLRVCVLRPRLWLLIFIMIIVEAALLCFVAFYDGESKSSTPRSQK